MSHSRIRQKQILFQDEAKKCKQLFDGRTLFAMNLHLATASWYSFCTNLLWTRTSKLAAWCGDWI
jgi:hypothetical protein